MWGCIILIGAILVFLLLAFKFKEIRHKFTLVIIAIVLIFFAFSFIQVYKSNNANLATFDGVITLGKLYFAWLGNLFGNVGKLSAYAIHQDWGLNVTNSTGP